jgi:hypothetical protein
MHGNSSNKTKARRLASTSVVPFAILLFAILGAVVLTVVAMAQRTSEAADERARRNITTALTEEVNDAARDLRTIMELERTLSMTAAGAATPANTAPLERVRMLGDFEAVSLIDKEGNLLNTAARLIYGKAAPEQVSASSLRWAAQELISKVSATDDFGPESRMIGRYMLENGNLQLIVAIQRK